MNFRNSLRYLHLWLLRFHRLGVRHPKKVLWSFALLFVLSIVATAKLQMLLSIDDLIDQDFKTYKGLLSLNSEFKDKNNVFLIISPKDQNQVISKSVLCDLKGWIQNQVDERHDITRILSAFGARSVKSTATTLSFPSIIKLNCLEKDNPESANIVASLKQLKASPWGNTLTSQGANDVAVNIYLADTLTDKRFGSFDTTIVKSLMDSLEKNVLSQHPEVKASWGGVAVYQYYLRKGYDLTAYLNLGTIFLIFFLFRILYGNYRSALLFIISIIVACVPIYGGLALTHCPIDVLTNILSLMLIVASLEDYMFIAYLQSKGGKNWQAPFRKLLMPGFFTSLTTMIGFGSLALTDLGIIRRFGIWAAVASLLEWIIIFVFIPAFLKIFPKFRVAPNLKPMGLARWTEKLSLKKIPRLVSYGALAAYVLGLAGAFHLRVSDAPPRVFPASHAVRKDLQAIEKSRGWQTEVSLVFSDFQKQSENEKVIEQFKRLNLVAAVEDPYEIENYLTQSAPDSIKDFIKNGWEDTPSGQRLLTSNGQARALLYLKDTDIAAVNSLIEQTKDLCAEGQCHLAGSLISYTEFGNRVLKTLISSLGISLVLVAFVLFYLLIANDRKNKIFIVLSALWGPAALLSLFYIFDMPIFYITSMFASILVGLAGDNTIQYIFASKENTLSKKSLTGGIQKLGGASVQISLSMMVISTVFFASYFEPLRILGLLLIGGLFLTLVGDLWLLKGLLPEV